MRNVVVNPNGRIVIRRSPFRPTDQVRLFISPDMVVVKRLRLPAKLSDLARRRPGRPIPLRDIVREVHEARRARTR